jgi:hypothetical protein
MEREEARVASNALVALPAHHPSAQRLSLPSQDKLRLALDAAVTSDDLKQLRETAATYEDVARRFKVAQGELVRLAIWRIDVERKLGEALARTVGRGGRGSKFQGETSKRGGATRGLPQFVNKAASKRYQDLAAIPEDLLRTYYSRAASRGVVPSAGGARSFAARVGGVLALKPQRVQSARLDVGAPRPLSIEVLEAVQRFFGTIDVVVGDVQLPCRTRLAAEVSNVKSLNGAVFVYAGDATREWLPLLAASRLNGVLDHAVAALPALTGAHWFRRALETGWSVCFLPCVGGLKPQMLAYHGPQTAAWQLVLGNVGAVAFGTSLGPGVPERRRV